MTLVCPGDDPAHDCSLPDIPDKFNGRRFVDVKNAVGRCDTCGRLWVSVLNYNNAGHWAPLRWWHREARRNLARRA